MNHGRSCENSRLHPITPTSITPTHITPTRFIYTYLTVYANGSCDLFTSMLFNSAPDTGWPGPAPPPLIIFKANIFRYFSV